MPKKSSPRDVLSANLRALMAARPELRTIKMIVEASRGSLSNGKLGRIYAASHTTDIDTLQHLADVFGLEPWQFMVEGLNPSALPKLADAQVLAQILEAVGKSHSQNPTHQLEQKPGPVVGPALEKAMNRVTGGKSERRKSGGVPKSGTRRRL